MSSVVAQALAFHPPLLVGVRLAADVDVLVRIRPAHVFHDVFHVYARLPCVVAAAVGWR